MVPKDLSSATSPAMLPVCSTLCFSLGSAVFCFRAFLGGCALILASTATQASTMQLHTTPSQDLLQGLWDHHTLPDLRSSLESWFKTCMTLSALHISCQQKQYHMGNTDKFCCQVKVETGNLIHWPLFTCPGGNTSLCHYASRGRVQSLYWKYMKSIPKFSGMSQLLDTAVIEKLCQSLAQWYSMCLDSPSLQTWMSRVYSKHYTAEC